MRNFKKILTVVIFLGLVVLFNTVLDYLLYPNTYSRAELYNMENTDLNQLLVGTSHGKCSIDPAVLDEVMGTRSFNSCQGGQYPIDSYYLVREADRVHNLKQVVYELDPAYWVTWNGENAQYISYLREFPNSLLKLAYWKDKLLDGDFRSTFFPWYFYRNQFQNIGETIKMKRSREYKEHSLSIFSSAGQTCREDGFISIHRVESEKAPVDPLNLWQDGNLLQKNVVWFEKMYEYCRKRGIQLVVVVTPVPKETVALYPENYRMAYDYLDEYMKGKDLVYLNYNRIEDERISRNLSDYGDQEGHMFEDTAASFSRCLAEKLKEIFPKK